MEAMEAMEAMKVMEALIFEKLEVFFVQGVVHSSN